MDFYGGPRDGDRIVVEGNPATFDVPVETGDARKPEAAIARYELREGAYHYVGQVPD